MPQLRILIADDDPKVYETFSRWLSVAKKPWILEAASNGQKALAALQKRKFDITILGYRMPGLTGLEVLKTITRQGILTKVIMLTGFVTHKVAFQAAKLGAVDFLLKPVLPAELSKRIEEVLRTMCPPPHILAEKLDGLLKTDFNKPTLTFADVYRHFGISKSYASKLFREHLETSFTQRLAYHRLEHAKHLLTTTEHPIYLISELCGFKNPARFSTTFSKIEGVSPKKFRQISGPEDKKWT